MVSSILDDIYTLHLSDVCTCTELIYLSGSSARQTLSLGSYAPLKHRGIDLQMLQGYSHDARPVACLADQCVDGSAINKRRCSLIVPAREHSRAA